MDLVAASGHEVKVDVVRNNQRNQVLSSERIVTIFILDNLWEFTCVGNASAHFHAVGLRYQSARSGKEVCTRNVVVNTTDNRTSVARCEDVFLYTHQNLGFRTGFLGLNDV